jgi:hypothetical protein
MKMFIKQSAWMIAAMGLLIGCSSTHNQQQEATIAPHSDDLLELLTGFGESLSKRNFAKAVDYMVPEEKAMMMEGGTVPADKQKALLALPLQKLIRHPAVRVEHGKIAGIYTLLPNLNQGTSNVASAPADGAAPDAAGSEAAPAEASGPMASASESGVAPSESDESSEAAKPAPQNDAKLRETVNKFFSAVNRKNWQSALALMNDSERKLLLDDKGRLKESSKQRLAQIDQKNREALLLQDGKLTGVTLLLPAD